MKDMREKKSIDLFRGKREERIEDLEIMIKGFRIVERRYRKRIGEIEMIERRGDMVMIVEVKERESFEEEKFEVKKKEMRRIEEDEDIWMKRKKDRERIQMSLDMVEVMKRRWKKNVKEFFKEGNYG